MMFVLLVLLRALTPLPELLFSLLVASMGSLDSLAGVDCSGTRLRVSTLARLLLVSPSWPT